MAKCTLQEIDGSASTGQVSVPPRSARLPQWVGLTVNPHAVLDALDATVIGVGSIGRNLAIGMVQMQIRTLRLIDRGCYKPESLMSQPITPADVGQPKASNTGRLCKQLSPRTCVLVHDGPVESLEVAELANTDLVLLATDNLAAEVEVGQRCLNLGKPLGQASVHGDTLVTQFRFFRNRDAEGACPRCGLGTAELADLNLETTFSCEGLAEGQPIAQTTTAPTRSTGFHCAQSANLALTQVLRHVLQLGLPLPDSLVEYCGYTNRMVTSPLARNPECPCDHSAWSIVTPPHPLGDCTLNELAAWTRGQGSVSFTVDDLSYVEKGTCARCGEQPVQRFVAAGHPAGACPSCAGPLVAQPYYTHRPVPISLVSLITDRPLRFVGAASPRSVLVRRSERVVLFRQTSK